MRNVRIDGYGDGLIRAVARPKSRLDDVRRIVLAAMPPAAAIAVFGVIYGSLMGPRIGAAATMMTSLLIFSGSVQFTLAALLASAAGPGALLVGAASLNLRNLALGAVMRPRVARTPLQRAGMAWFLTDEAVGLTIVSDEEAGRALVVSGGIFYVSWQVGTALGLAGASLDALGEAAGAVFPVLFIGLAAAACPSWSMAVRTVVAALAAGTAAWLWPGSEGVVAVLVGLAVAIPGRRA